MNALRFKPLWDLGLIPFHFSVCDTPSNRPFPDWLPFVAGVDNELDLLVQLPDESVAEELKKVYVHNSQIGAAMQETGLGRAYCDSFLAFLEAAPEIGPLRGKRVLELGCGSGYMLGRMRDKGASVLGVEPGNAFIGNSEAAGVTILNREFERCEFQEQFDVIVHYGVAEHMRDPFGFFRRQLELLAEGGHIVFAVPDCEPFIQQGDLSVFIHEHWNYFTKASLARLAAKAGARVGACVSADVGHVLYSHWQKGSEKSCAEDATDWESVIARMQQGRRNVSQWFSAASAAGATVGVFAPTRLLNYVTQETVTKDMRLFDDNPDWTARFVPPLPWPVENRKSLLAKPVNRLLVMSRAFGKKIAASLREQGLPGQSRITLISEVV